MGPLDDFELDQATDKAHGIQQITSTSEKGYQNDSDIESSPTSAEIRDQDEKVAASQLLKWSFLTHNGRKRRVPVPKNHAIFKKKRRYNSSLPGFILPGSTVKLFMK